MKFYSIKGANLVNINITKYLIDWDYVVSKPQKKVKDFLFPFWKSKVVLEEFKLPSPSRSRVDLINLTDRIAIEVSPSGSHSFNPFFH